MSNVPTPHNSAKLDDIAKTVIMPGDPLRAKYIAEKFLSNIVCYNQIRAMYGYTGYYKGIKVSVQGSGMGCPSIGIHSKELFDFYGVENIIRAGSAGSLDKDLKLKDIVIADSTTTNSNYPEIIKKSKVEKLFASRHLLGLALKTVKDNNIKYKSGNIFTSDVFYSSKDELMELSKNGVLAVEMETAALYTNADLYKKNALTLLSISDNPLTGEGLNSEERQNSFDEMIRLSLEIAITC